jgi:hypothetical protein
MLTFVVLLQKNSARSQQSQRGSSPANIENPNRYTAIKNPNNPPGFNNFEFSNRYKTHFFSTGFPFLPALLLTTTRRRCYLPTAHAIQYPAIHTGDSNPA